MPEEVIDISYVGNVLATLEELTECFGEPDVYDAQETPFSWSLVFDDGMIVTIYAWKETPVGPYDWHIGGASEDAITRVANILNGESID